MTVRAQVHARLQHRLDRLQQQHRYRQLLTAESPQSRQRQYGQNSLLNFCSNDYLSLANHSDVKQAFRQGVSTWGVGAGASHLVNGHTQAHHVLQEALADWLGYPAVLLFSTGYMANLALSTLFDRNDGVLHDKLNHASLIDSSRHHPGFKRYRHTDLVSLRQQLSKQTNWVITDGVFSMDGDTADLTALQQTIGQSALLIVDDAHGLGVLGNQGRGCLEQQQIKPADVDILVGTLSKAFGGSGAFIAADRIIIDTLIQQARPYIYTTAMPPAMAVAMLTSLTLVQDPSRREQLDNLHQSFLRGARQLGLKVEATPSAIQPLVLGTDEAALTTAKNLRKQGIHVSAIRPPTVPEGTARLRIAFTAEHSLSDVDRLLDSLAIALPDH